MRTEITPAAHAQALVAAEALKKQLEARLINKTTHAFSCSCGACKFGPSRVVAINIPMQFPYQIAMWLLWTCEMEDIFGKRWSQGISTYLKRKELYPLFRKAFAGIDVSVNHTMAQMYNGSPAPFNSSGRTVEISARQPAYVRPAGDLSESIWTEAELRVTTYKGEEGPDGVMISCNVDCFAFGQQNYRDRRFYQIKGKGQAFFIYMADGPSNDTYLPIARVVAVDKQRGRATLELDESVEAFQPA